MITLAVTCPSCHSNHIIKHGKTKAEKQRYSCQNEDCHLKTFILDYTYNGCLKKTKETVIDMAVNGSGIRDTGRVLNISPNTVINTLKSKEEDLDFVNKRILEQGKDYSSISVIIKPVEEAELDEMWSFVGKKANQRWLWHAIDHISGEILAYTFGSRKDSVFETLQSLLKPFGIKRFYSDDWGAYTRKIKNEEHIVSKKYTQKIERKHLTLRIRIKRLARKTICFSKIAQMHDIVIGLFINRYEFGRNI